MVGYLGKDRIFLEGFYGDDLILFAVRKMFFPRNFAGFDTQLKADVDFCGSKFVWYFYGLAARW